MKLHDTVAILTGSGEAVAQRSLEEGARCVLADVKPADAFAQPLIERFPQRVHALTADITRREDIERAVVSSIECFGQIDILFNNAAIFDMRPLLDELASGNAAADRAVHQAGYQK